MPVPYCCAHTESTRDAVGTQSPADQLVELRLIKCFARAAFDRVSAVVDDHVEEAVGGHVGVFHTAAARVASRNSLRATGALT